MVAPKVEPRNRSLLRENICGKPENEERKWENRSTMLSRQRVKCKVNGFITTIKNKLQEVYFFLIADSLNDNAFNICQQMKVVSKTRTTHNGF